MLAFWAIYVLLSIAAHYDSQNKAHSEQFAAAQTVARAAFHVQSLRSDLPSVHWLRPPTGGSLSDSDARAHGEKAVVQGTSVDENVNLDR